MSNTVENATEIRPFRWRCPRRRSRQAAHMSHAYARRPLITRDRLAMVVVP
jgi:hypothetical protein